MIAKTYIRKCECKPDIVTEPLTYAPRCTTCREYMVEGDEW